MDKAMTAIEAAREYLAADRIYSPGETKRIVRELLDYLDCAQTLALSSPITALLPSSTSP